MRRHLALLIAVLAPALAMNEGPHSGMNLDDGPQVFDVTRYGAVADATIATGCGWRDDTDPNNPSCTTLGTGTNNQDAFNDAIDAAGDAGEGIVFIPCGDYRIGPQSGGSGYTAGIDLDRDNVTLRGESAQCVRLLPNRESGGFVMTACADADCSGVSTLKNVVIEKLTFLDDDPEDNGHDYAIVYGSEAGTTPASGDAVTWNGGTEEGILYRYDDGESPAIYRVYEKTTPPSDIDGGETLSGDGGNWTLTGITLVDDNSEESHALHIAYAEDVVVRGNIFQAIGDESVEVRQSDNVRITDNTFLDCPSIPSGGTCLDLIAGCTNCSATNNSFDGGVKAATGYTSSMLGIRVVGAGPSSNILVSNNVLSDSSTQDSLSYVGTGISIFPGGDTISDLTITGNVVDMDDADTNGGALQIQTNANEVFGLVIANNRITGRVVLKMHVDNTMSVIGNLITGDNGRGIEVAGASVLIKANNILDFPLEAIFLPDSSNMVNILGNTIRNTSSGAATAVIRTYSGSSITGQALIAGNLIEPAEADGVNVAAISCVRDTNITIVDNLIVDPDQDGILNCLIVDSNKLVDVPRYGVYIDGQDTNSMDGARVTNNTFENIGNVAVHADNVRYGHFSGNSITNALNPVIHMIDNADGVNDYNVCVHNISMTAGDTIQCGDGDSPGDDVGCADDGGGAANTICGGNIIVPP